MINEMLGKYEVGIYAVAVRLSEAFHFLPILLTTSFFPAILNARKINKALYILRLQRLYTFLLWMALSAALTMTFVGESLVIALFGQAYKEAGSILIVHAWTNIFIFISAGFGRYLLAENLTLINMYRVILGAIVNILLNLLLIPYYGIIGSAYATLLSLALVNYAFDIFNKDLWHQLHMKIIAFYYPFILIYKLFKRVKT
jgi:O-antigen/teichoic acid export membrane protein